MKCEIMRVGHSEGHVPHAVDVRPLEATIRDGFQLGKSMTVYFARMDDGVLVTTKVVKVEDVASGIFRVHTKNSIYWIRKGWGEEYA